MSKINDPNTPLYYYIPSTSKAIQYSPGWTEPAGPPFSRFDFSRFGEPPFADTSVSVPNVVVHASLSTNFTGTRVVVEGTVDVPRGAGTSALWRMTCRIDGKDVTVAPDSMIHNRRANAVPLCDASDLSPDGVHSLNFTIHVDAVADFSPEVHFDTLKVTPSPSTNLENALIYMQHNASMIDYDDPDPKSLKWRVTDLGHYTSTNGSKVVINFSGTRLRWYGFHEPSFGGSIEESTAMYILDNYPSNTFTIPRISSAPSARQIGLPYLTTEELAPGMHRLEVTYASTIGRPLGLHHLVVQNAPLPSAPVTSQTQTPSTRPLSTHNPLGNTPSQSAAKSGILSKPAVIAMAVNMVVGGLVLIGIAVFLWRRRRSKIMAIEAAQPYDPFIQPSTDIHQHKMEFPGSSSSSATTPKGTPIEDLPLRRGSLHIRSLNDDETPPPYHQNINSLSR